MRSENGDSTWTQARSHAQEHELGSGNILFRYFEPLIKVNVCVKYS